MNHSIMVASFDNSHSVVSDKQKSAARKRAKITNGWKGEETNPLYCI